MPRGSLPALLYQIESRLGEPLPERIPAYARVAWVIKHLDNLLDLPRQPLPLSASRALATKPVLPPMSGPAVAGATKES